MSTRLMRECRQQRGNRTGMATRNFKGRQIWEWTFPGLQAPVGCRKEIPPTFPKELEHSDDFRRSPLI